MARRSRTEMAILGFLTWRPMSGYEIRTAISDSVDNFWSESYGQIYPTLHRLTDEGAIELVEDEDDSEGTRETKRYRVTSHGLAKLRDWLGTEVEPRPRRHELLLKLFFGRHADAGALRAHLETYRDRVTAERVHYDQIRSELAASTHPDRVFWQTTLRFGELEAEAHLRWCEETLETLDARSDDPESSERHDRSTAPIPFTDGSLREN